MSRQMKLPDDVYERLTTMAKDNYRTYGQQITLLMDSYDGTTRGSAEVLESLPAMPPIENILNDKLDGKVTARSLSDIKKDIDAWDAEMKDSIDPTIVQDADTLYKNKSSYYSHRAKLWEEYNETKNREG